MTKLDREKLNNIIEAYPGILVKDIVLKMEKFSYDEVMEGIGYLEGEGKVNLSRKEISTKERIKKFQKDLLEKEKAAKLSKKKKVFLEEEAISKNSKLNTETYKVDKSLIKERREENEIFDFEKFFRSIGISESA